MRPADFRLGSWAPVAAVWQCVQNAPFQTKYTFRATAKALPSIGGIGRTQKRGCDAMGQRRSFANTCNGLVVIVEERKANKVLVGAP